MVPPPVEQSDGTTAVESQRPHPTPFLTKTYQLVDDHTIDDVISWNEEGTAFVVWNPTDVSRDLLPMFFKHNNFSSFVRQLNTYGFRKVVPDRWEFSNECFWRGEKLRKQNVRLNKELTQMKKLCNNIFNMVSYYPSFQSESGSPACNGGFHAAKPLDLLPGRRFTYEDVGPRLFAVTLGVNRGRIGEGCIVTAEEQRSGSRIKSEPLDCQVGGGDKP